ncbi:hypothetical protein OH492_19005 [Vibrio chagasii]|nr:hypothetical protein [Vibrio chagasii]
MYLLLTLFVQLKPKMVMMRSLTGQRLLRLNLLVPMTCKVVTAATYHWIRLCRPSPW